MRARPVTIGLLTVLALACGGRDLYVGMPEHVKRRHVALEGANNFRDLGGYATADGRTVRWGLLYRSDNLSHLTDADLATLSRLGIKLVCDFRSAPEKAEEPDRLPAESPPQVAELPIFDESFSPSAFRERLMSGDLEDLDLRKALTDANRLFATRFAPQYAEMLELVSRPAELPALVHCTGGKDRAGFASAVILRTLGVPEETVFEDFLLTNHYTADHIERTLWRIRLASLFRVDPERVRPVLSVERGYLAAAFEEIAAKYGSFDGYRREALDFSDAQTEAFRRLALE
ncbi:MAG: tyrosine-protein phosphatase [Myxococcota bacterium]